MPASLPNPESSLRFGVAILAAGASTRMGSPKLLLPWADTTVIGHLISQWRKLNSAQTAIVLRPHDSVLAAELDRLHFRPANRIANPQPERGMFSSIQCAAAWAGWQADISHWAIVLGDQPHLRPDTLLRLLDFAVRHPESICQPARNGRAAHPVILPRPAFNELKGSTAATLKDFLSATAIQRVQCETDDPGLGQDLDTPEDYRRLTVR